MIAFLRPHLHYLLVSSISALLVVDIIDLVVVVVVVGVVVVMMMMILALTSVPRLLLPSLVPCAHIQEGPGLRRGS